MKKANAAAEEYREPLETNVFKSPLPCNERMYVATNTAHQATYYLSLTHSLSSHGHTASSGSTPGTARLIAIAMS